MNYAFSYVDSINILHYIPYDINCYHNLMELIWDEGFEDWGDCKGRAWCGTCHVHTTDMKGTSIIDEDEKQRLSKLSNARKNSRLACQIPLNKKINGAKISYIGDD